jgi:formylglycine-generating enzyme
VDVTLTLAPEPAAPAAAAPAPAKAAASRISSPKAGDVWKEPVTGMAFVWVPGGCFMMGQTDSEKQYLIKDAGQETYDKYFKRELPRHEVCVDGFWMGKYEVTNRQYRKYKSGHDSKSYKGVNLNGDDQPVVEVSWEDAKAFIQWLNTRTGQRFALPTEAQWEYAARGGTQSFRFWGDRADDACRYANVYDTTGKAKFNFSWSHHNCNDGYAGTAPVGRFQPNAYGLHDMLGNVWEWCEDVFDEKAYSKQTRNNPVVTSGGTARVYRGGSWFNIPWLVRAAYRDWNTPISRYFSLGFRLALPQVRQE